MDARRCGAKNEGKMASQEEIAREAEWLQAHGDERAWADFFRRHPEQEQPDWDVNSNPGGARQRERGVRSSDPNWPHHGRADWSHHGYGWPEVAMAHAERLRSGNWKDRQQDRPIHESFVQKAGEWRQEETAAGRGFGGHITAERQITGNPKKGQPCITVIKGKKVIATGSAMSDLAECKAIAKKANGTVMVADGCGVQANGPRTKPDRFARSSTSPQGALVLHHHADRLPSTKQVIADADANRQWYVCGPCLDANPIAPAWFDGPISEGEFAGIPAAACDYVGVAHADGCNGACWSPSVHANGPRSHAAGQRVGRGAKAAGRYVAHHAQRGAKAAWGHAKDFGRGVAAGVRGNPGGARKSPKWVRDLIAEMIDWEGAGHYWLGEKRGNIGGGSMDLGHCKNVSELRYAIAQCVNDGDENTDWSDWSCQKS